MQIEHYEFGRIRIDGRTYRNDVLLWPGQIKSDWWRLEGHLLQVNDVTEALAADPQVLVVGQGDPGNMQVDPALAAHLRAKGVELLTFPTRQACQVINELNGKRRLAAALHLTC
jgi:hypothetical protein